MSPKPARSGTDLTAKQLLSYAYSVLEDPPAVLVGRWPRAVALLARQALETSLAELWAKRDAKVGWATERSQLLCLPGVLGDRRRCGRRHACLELPERGVPPASLRSAADGVELAAWVDIVDELRRAVDAIPARR